MVVARFFLHPGFPKRNLNVIKIVARVEDFRNENQSAKTSEQESCLTTTIHMICGPVGAGKTTYALELARRENAIVFSMDDWMRRLFGGDVPDATDMTGIDFAWFAERVDRCEDQIWQVVEQMTPAQVNVILDFGFIRLARREKARQRAAQLGLESRLHILDVDFETRRERVTKRNREQGQTYSFETTPAMLDFAERLFEAPGPGEQLDSILVNR
ncbi:AAA family ATPase [Asticcacaulis solisilvae]|uniref:AAA family ATPase n=1 Tax=Asticcacaulis solisilvae TaxID=1217274 RepID=UPI003FD76F88